VRVVERDVPGERPHALVPGFVASVCLEERGQVRERGAGQRTADALLERRDGDEPEHLAAVALDHGDQREHADQRHGDAVAQQQPRLCGVREVRRHLCDDRGEHGVHLARRKLRLPGRDGGRAPARARGHVRVADESAVADDAVHDQRTVVRVLGQQLVGGVRRTHDHSPVKRGRRFSANAAIASMRSFDCRKAAFQSDT